MNSPIKNFEMIKHRIRIKKHRNTKETHIPLLEAEFAGCVPCEAGKLSKKPFFERLSE